MADTLIQGTTIIEDKRQESTSVPVGCIIAWLKSFTNTPSIPSGWVECNGAVLSDADSVYNGVTLPDLNGNNQFARGNSTSGGTGGTESTTTRLSSSGTTANTDLDQQIYVLDSDPGGFIRKSSNPGGGSATVRNLITDSSSFSILPKYYDVVWIMKVK